MDFTIQSASSHTQGAGPSLASRAPGASFAEWPCPQCLGLRLSPGAPGQTTGPAHGLVHTPHPAWSWKPGMGEPRSLRFSLDSEAATGGSRESVGCQPHSCASRASPALPCILLLPLPPARHPASGPAVAGLPSLAQPSRLSCFSHFRCSQTAFPATPPPPPSAAMPSPNFSPPSPFIHFRSP